MALEYGGCNTDWDGKYAHRHPAHGADEEARRRELLGATVVGRHAALSAALIVTFGLTAGLTYGLSTGDVGRELPRVLAASLAYLQAVWLQAGITVALFGLLPRVVTIVSWIALTVCVLIDLGGELHQVSQLVLNMSPYTHVPKVLISEGSAVPLIWLLCVVALFTAIGLVGFRLRDTD